MFLLWASVLVCFCGCSFHFFFPFCFLFCVYLGRGGGSLVEWWIHDQKISGLTSSRSGGRIFFSRVNLSCWLLFWYPFHPIVTTIGGRLRLNIHASYICPFEWSDTVNWWMAVWRTQTVHQDSSSLSWYQPSKNQNSTVTTSVDIQNMLCKAIRIVTPSESWPECRHRQ